MNYQRMKRTFKRGGTVTVSLKTYRTLEDTLLAYPNRQRLRSELKDAIGDVPRRHRRGSEDGLETVTPQESSE